MMGKGRTEAFSDGVIAIIITIMVLELKVPHGDSLHAVKPLYPVFLSYILSFVFIGIYWNNHHHMMHVVERVDGTVLWANLHLLFWLSLIPFTSGWMGENHFTTWPVAFYGMVLLMAGIAYYILLRSLIRLHGKESTLATAIGNDKKGISSVAINLVAVMLAFVNPWISIVLYALIAGIWFIPDKRIEKKISEHHTTPIKHTGDGV
jgi:uncharacterized membrane protein